MRSQSHCRFVHRDATVLKSSRDHRAESIDKHGDIFMRAIALSLVLAVTVIVPISARANPVCTTEPKEKWMSEAAIKAKIAALGYHKIRSFKTTESCYEIYGSDKHNKLVEVYFNPVTGEIVPSVTPAVK
jgi:hypothetical protein